MKDPLPVNPIVLSVALVCISIGATALLRRIGILDIPNARSSHERPVPRIGGIAIVLTFFVGLAGVALAGMGFAASWLEIAVFAVASLGIAGIGFLDDLGRLHSVRWKLAAQLIAAVFLVLFGVSFQRADVPVIGAVELGIWGSGLTVLWLVGITNAINFMDGLDGIVAGTCIVGFFFLGGLAFAQGAGFVYILCLLLAAGTAGFFVFNFPKASIFMGDVGSQFLGFSLGALAVFAAQHGDQGIPMLVVPLLLFHFIFDTLFTFFRRLVAGDNVSKAHRTHLYQLLNQLGMSHAAVSCFHFGVTVLQGIGAVAMVGLSEEYRYVVFLPFMVFQFVYADLVIRLARKRGIIGAHD